jgi:hypothetical protein
LPEQCLEPTTFGGDGICTPSLLFGKPPLLFGELPGRVELFQAAWQRDAGGAVEQPQH